MPGLLRLKQKILFLLLSIVTTDFTQLKVCIYLQLAVTQPPLFVPVPPWRLNTFLSLSVLSLAVNRDPCVAQVMLARHMIKTGKSPP